MRQIIGFDLFDILLAKWKGFNLKYTYDLQTKVIEM